MRRKGRYAQQTEVLQQVGILQKTRLQTSFQTLKNHQKPQKTTRVHHFLPYRTI